MADFVFRKKGNHLEFVGDFEGLYRSDSDPWDQSGRGGLTSNYYLASRARLVWSLLRRRFDTTTKFAGLEVGCGHGHLVGLLNTYTTNNQWSGMDISPTAIVQACKLYPDSHFETGDITKMIRPYKFYDVIILGQLLWYVMHALDTVVANCYNLLGPNGALIITQAYLREGEQLYGREIIDGFDGTVRLFIERYSQKFRMIEACYDDTLQYNHHDGLLIFRKRG